MSFYHFPDRLPDDQIELTEEEYFQDLLYSQYELEPLDFWQRDAETFLGIMSGVLVPDTIQVF